jgi:hypothetical protein
MAANGQSKYLSSPQEWEDIYERFRDLYVTCELGNVKKELEKYGIKAT